MLKVNLEKAWDTIKVKAFFIQKDNEILCIIGPSACGKTTLLNMISGIIIADNGEININNEIIFNKEKNFNKPLNKREIGYIQQKDTLFPHLNVEKNILYGRRKKENSIDMNDILEFLEIKDILQKRPRELSGGQKQRVSIARALAAEPKLLLMDEPFSALDNIMRSKLKSVVKDIRDKFNIPIIFITHSLEEAYFLGDRIAIMKEGRILQIDYRDEIFQNPNSKEVASFIGVKNILNTALSVNLLKTLGYDELSNVCMKKGLNVCVWSENIKLHSIDDSFNNIYEFINEGKNTQKNNVHKTKPLKEEFSINSSMYKYKESMEEELNLKSKYAYGVIIEEVNELNEVSYKIKVNNFIQLDSLNNINSIKEIINSDEQGITLWAKILGRVCKEKKLKVGECVGIHIDKDHILMLK